MAHAALWRVYRKGRFLMDWWFSIAVGIGVVGILAKASTRLQKKIPLENAGIYAPLVAL